MIVQGDAARTCSNLSEADEPCSLHLLHELSDEGGVALTDLAHNVGSRAQILHHSVRVEATTLINTVIKRLRSCHTARMHLAKATLD